MSRSLARCTRTLALAVAVALAAPLLPGVKPVHAGSGFTQFRWGNSGITLSSSSNKNSNMTGLWQAILNAQGCNLAVDGNYGNITTWYTAIFQNEILGGNNGGVMTPAYLNQVSDATNPVDGARLVNQGVPDGYGTQSYGYYAGTENFFVNMGWNPFAAQWLFSQYPLSNPYYYVAATPAKTIGSVACRA